MSRAGGEPITKGSKSRKVQLAIFLAATVQPATLVPDPDGNRKQRRAAKALGESNA